MHAVRHLYTREHHFIILPEYREKKCHWFEMLVQELQKNLHTQLVMRQLSTPPSLPALYAPAGLRILFITTHAN